MLPPPPPPPPHHHQQHHDLRSSFVLRRRRSTSSSSNSQEDLVHLQQQQQRQPPRHNNHHRRSVEPRSSSSAPLHALQPVSSSSTTTTTTIPLATHSELCLLGLEPLFSPPPSRKRPKHHHHNNNVVTRDDSKGLRRQQQQQQQQMKNKKSSPPTAASAASAASGCVSSSSSSFSSLPNEMILRVLSHLPLSSLPSVCRVSRRLSSLAEDESLWTRVDAHSRSLTVDSIRTILRRNPTVLRVARGAVHGGSGWGGGGPPSSAHDDHHHHHTPSSKSLLMPVPPPQQQQQHPCSNQVEFPVALNLRLLDMSLIETPSPSLLASILRASPNLVKLSLENATLSNEVVAAIPTTHLDTLNLALAGASGVDHTHFETLFRGAKKLVSVNVSWLRGVKWSGLELKCVLDALPQTVAHLNVAGFRDALSDQHVTSLLTALGSTLVDLDISDSPLLTSLVLRSLIESCPMVEHVGLSRCYSITPGSFKWLASLKSLRSLDIFTLLKEPSLKYLAETHLPHVQVNLCPLSSIARPTVGNKRSSIWGVPVVGAKRNVKGVGVAGAGGGAGAGGSSCCSQE